jgi:hypothetical protein
MSDTAATDLQPLARYTRNRAEDAFAELVRRHVDLVHSAALRQVRSPQLAEEVAQSVFTDLARNAAQLRPDTILTAWLYQVTRRTAIDVGRHHFDRRRVDWGNVLDGQVMGEYHARHRHQEWLSFLRRLDREFPPELTLHLVMGNYGTYKEPQVRAWLQQLPRFVCHFIPTSSSWLNLVERWFAELSEKAIRRGSFVSVPDLQAAIESFLAAWNVQPQPFIWTATVDDIMAKIERARPKLEQLKTGCTLPRVKKRAKLT